MDSQDEVVVEQRVFKVKLPMRIKTSSKKKQPLNLNVYRNLHFRSLSSQKNKFYEIARKLLRDIPPLGVITLHYEVYPKSLRRMDIMNVGSIVDKYFSDCLTETGVIEDDDYTHIPLVSFAFGGLAEEEHVLVTITETEPRKEATPMRVLLDQVDIQRALTTYVSTLHIPNAAGVTLAVVDGEITAEITFVPCDSDDHVVMENVEIAPVEDKPKRRRGGRPPGSKNKPKISDPDPEPQPEETADVDAPVQDSADVSSTGDTSGAEVEAPEATTEEAAPTETGLDTSKGKPRKNLFGDKDVPSSEDDGGTAEAALDNAPTPEAAPVKRGSIFDA